VTKSIIWNGITPNTDTTFSITITGPSYPAGNTKTLTAGGDLTWTGLIPGEYTVTEGTLGSMWKTPVIAGSPASVPVTGGEATATVTNERYLGSLKVTKSIIWNGIEPNTDTIFSITITGPSYPAGNTKTLTAGGDLTWTGLIPGEYTVTEGTLGSQWKTPVIAGSPASVPVNGGEATATVTNERYLGSLKVTKSIIWNGITPDATTTFSITITGPSYPAGNTKTLTAGGDLTWTGLIPGEYTVTEGTLGSQWKTPVIAGSPATVPVTGGEATATVTNERYLGSLKVTKSIIWNGITPDATTTFSITITGPSYPAGNTKTLTAGGDLTWTDLIPGQYTVTEGTLGTQWKTPVIAGSPATVPVTGGEATATVTNERYLGSLKVTKSIIWNGITPDATTTFSITITGPSYPAGDTKTLTAAGDLTWTGLIPGQYTVTEGTLGTQWKTPVIAGSPATVPVTGGEATATVTNERYLGSLKVTKSIIWNGNTPDTSTTFSITITGPSYPAGNTKTLTAAGDLTWTGLIPGNYTITEGALGGEWKAPVIGGSPAAVPVNGGEGSATVTNERKVGDLRVTKSIIWNGITPNTDTTFSITITGPSYPAGNTKTLTAAGDLLWTGLIPGDYTITEGALGSEWKTPVIADVVTNIPITDGESHAFVTNERKLGSLKVTKSIIWNGNTPNTDTTFSITITGPSYPGGNTKTLNYEGELTWTNLIPGSYTVSEYALGVQWEIPVIGGSPASVPTNGGQAVATVTNEMKTGELIIEKKDILTGLIIDLPGVTFRVDPNPYSDSPATLLVVDNGIYDTNPDNGVIQLVNLPLWSYVITEVFAPAGYDIDPTPMPADLSAGELEVTVTSEDHPLSRLEIRKFLDADGDGVKDDDEDYLAGWHFTITGPDGYVSDGYTNIYGLITKVNLKPGTYTVTEEEQPNWELTTMPNPKSLAIAEGETGEFLFGNQPIPVPVSSGWGLGALIAGLAGSMLFLVRRRVKKSQIG